MLPETSPRPSGNSSKVNLLIASAFHSAIVLVLVFFAAREGLLGKQLRKIAVEMIKENQPEKPREPDKPREQPAPGEARKVVETPRFEPLRAQPPTGPVSAPPPAVSAVAPSIAPPSSELPSFEFSGGKTVQSSSDPVQLYRGFVEYSLRSHWSRPENIADDHYVAEVDVSLDRNGTLSDPQWKKGSGDSRWDDSVRAAIAATKSLERAPPPSFPSRIVVRFDVQDASQPIIQ
jgi:outer membrane biosynthesis protein TonB